MGIKSVHSRPKFGLYMAVTIDNFDKSLNSFLVEDADILFKRSAVYDITLTNEGAWTSYVDGGNDEFAVRVAFNGKEVVKSNCTCAHAGFICKHGVALLFALRHEFLDTFKNVDTVIVDAAGAFAAAQKDKKDQKARKVNSDYTPEGLYEVYKSLPESEKRVVKIAALVYEPFSMTKIMEVFNAGFQHLDKPLTASWAKIWLLELNQAAFLLYLPSSQYRIKSDFADYLIEKEFETDK